METFGNQNQQKSAIYYHCEKCDYTTSRKYNYNSHLHSLKHNNGNQMETLTKQSKEDYTKCEMSEYICFTCDKQFKNRSGLWKHNNKYHFNPNKNQSNLITTELVLELIKDNKDLKNIILEQTHTINNVVDKCSLNGSTNNSHNTINSHNKAFNLNVFLNETCKEAINISDFVNSIKVSFAELENTGRKGYITGISNIITKNLNELEEHQRPLHCSDYKREIIYIKDNDKWEKETDDKPILTNAIKVIANKNIKRIKDWKDKHPDCTSSDSKNNNTYLKIVSNSMNGITEDEGNKNISKIISNISKETIIQKC
jgi:hypothetical protein